MSPHAAEKEDAGRKYKKRDGTEESSARNLQSQVSQAKIPYKDDPSKRSIVYIVGRASVLSYDLGPPHPLSCKDDPVKGV
jgi:hypothetical protein